MTMHPFQPSFLYFEQVVAPGARVQVNLQDLNSVVLTWFTAFELDNLVTGVKEEGPGVASPSVTVGQGLPLRLQCVASVL